MKRPHRIWMIVLFFAAIALPVVHAERYYVLTAHLAGQQVVVSSVKMENVPMAIPEGDGGHLIEVTSMRHEVLFSGRYTLGGSPAPLYVPYDVEGNYLSIKKSTGEVLQRVSVAIFSTVCGDGLCQSSETPEMCSVDCRRDESAKPVHSDESVQPVQEKSTKPAQVETPAQTLKKPIIKKPAKKNIGTLILVGGVLGIVLTSGGFWIMVKKAKEQRLGQIRQYLQKYAYYPPDQVKRALLARGIKEEDIEQALRQN